MIDGNRAVGLLLCEAVLNNSPTPLAKLQALENFIKIQSKRCFEALERIDKKSTERMRSNKTHLETDLSQEFIWSRFDDFVNPLRLWTGDKFLRRQHKTIVREAPAAVY